jgi:hypothetical protein
MEALDLLKNAIGVGKWIYDQLNTMKENETEAKVLASRIRRLTAIVEYLKNVVKPEKKSQAMGGAGKSEKHKRGTKSSDSELRPLIPEVLDCLARVEECFDELARMIHVQQSSRGFTAKAKTFFGAGNFKDQLTAANTMLSQVLGDLQASMTAQGLVVGIETAALVQKQYSDLVGSLKEVRELLEATTPRTVPVTSPPDKKPLCFFFLRGNCM